MFGIGELARKTQCPIDTIRYYEKLGILPLPQRTQGNHRLYNQQHAKRLNFILKTRSLGFSLENTRELLDLAETPNRSCGETLGLVEQHLQTIETKLQELTQMQHSLREMAKRCQSCCPGAKAPECTIVEDLNS
jgi:MerR family transcriptional regulator, mercuric resistance operon regulatory protein